MARCCWLSHSLCVCVCVLLKPRLRGAPCGIGALPRRDPTLTSSLLGHGATFPAKPALYYVCLRRSPASIRIGRRREDQSQDKEEKGESEAIAVNVYSSF